MEKKREREREKEYKYKRIRGEIDDRLLISAWSRKMVCLQLFPIPPQSLLYEGIFRVMEMCF